MKFRVAQSNNDGEEGRTLSLEEAAVLIDENPDELYANSFIAESMMKNGYILEVILEEDDIWQEE